MNQSIGTKWIAIFVVLMLSGLVFAQDAANTVTEEDIVTGSMNIDFKTRTQQDTSGDLKEGSAAMGAQDKYNFLLHVAKTTEFSGDTVRQPKLFSSVLGRTKQNAKLAYNVNIAVLNPRDLKQKKNVGKWVGEVAVDPTTGAYNLGGGESPLRIAIDAVGKAAAFTDKFGGRLVGKAEKKENLGSYTYKRLIGDKTVEITVKKSDPMR